MLEPTPLLPVFEWMERHPLSVWINGTSWFFAIDQALHLVMLAIFVGALLAVDLRLLGRGLRHQTVSEVARRAQPWLIAGLVGLLLTGVPQLMSNASKQFYSPFFWLKMEVMAVALVYTFTIRRKVASMDEARLGGAHPKIIGTLSLLLWTGVAIPARLIGLLS